MYKDLIRVFIIMTYLGVGNFVFLKIRLKVD